MAEIDKKRKEAKKILGKYKGLEVTWYKFDCGEDGCDKCEVCKYLNFLEYAGNVAPPGSKIQYDNFIDRYLNIIGIGIMPIRKDSTK